MKENKEGIPL